MHHTKEKARHSRSRKSGNNFRSCARHESGYMNMKLVRSLSRVGLKKYLFYPFAAVLLFMSAILTSCKDEVTVIVILTCGDKIVVGNGLTMLYTNMSIIKSSSYEETKKWTSSNPNVAEVDDAGKITTKSVGEATITVTVTITTHDGTTDSSSDSCTITVVEKPVSVTGVTLAGCIDELFVGEEFTLAATVEPADAANKEVVWTSDNPDVAEVDSNGKVAAKSSGNAVIIVSTKDGGKIATCIVKVASATSLNFLYEVR